MNKKKPEDIIGKKKVKLIDIEPYSQQCILVVNGQFKDAMKLLEKNKGNKNCDETLKHIEENKEDYFKEKKYNESSLYTKLPNGYVMLIDHGDDWIETIGQIVHECTHLTHYVLTNAGITLTHESEEAFTYLVEDLVERIIRIVYPPLN